MGKGSTKTSWEHFMQAVSAADRINKKNRTRPVKMLSLKEQLEKLEKSIDNVIKHVEKLPEEEPISFSYAADALTVPGYNHNKQWKG